MKRRVSFEVMDYNSENIGNSTDGGSSVKDKRNGLMKRLTSVYGVSKLDRMKSTPDQALKGLKFTSKADRDASWTAVEERFVEITATTDGLLPRSKFGECIGKKLYKLCSFTDQRSILFGRDFGHDGGMYGFRSRTFQSTKSKRKQIQKFEELNHRIDEDLNIVIIGLDSEDFALGLFDSLARKRHITTDMIEKRRSSLKTFVDMHPFSITSAPQDDYLSVHIKSVGDWTEDVQKVFSELRDMYHGANNPNFFYSLPKIIIDGPYGAPAQDYKKYEVVLLVGLGIGATPMISIIKDINNNNEAKEHAQLNRIEKRTQQQHQQGKKESFKTRKAYFYWLTKEQGSYNWFKNIINEIVERDTNNVIELHNYCTSIYPKGDVRSTFIHMLQSINHAKYGMDIVSGTKFMTNFAKPNWKNVYEHIAMDHPSSHVGVFYCGELALAKELRLLNSEFTYKTTTKFSFHQENFCPQC